MAEITAPYLSAVKTGLTDASEDLVVRLEALTGIHRSVWTSQRSFRRTDLRKEIKKFFEKEKQEEALLYTKRAA